MAASTSASASAPAGTGYDVFLSFRGVDTRLNFTDHLYQALKEARLEIFMDDQVIKTGDRLRPELEAAIQQSKASIIVISKNYAFSTWCLDELALIWELKMRCDSHIVYPIFYHVEPSHVRHLEGTFGEAMNEHRKANLDETNITRWGQALKEVAGIAGAKAAGRESEFIKNIVKEICDKLPQETSFTLPMLIGMDNQVREINAWLKDGSSNAVDIFTICGIPGIGKTALAKYIYYSNVNGAFDGRESFLEVEDIGSRSILQLQNELLKNIGRWNNEISDVNQGTNAIKNALKAGKTLLVLDGVTDVRQLNSLLGKEGFCPGTKVIITTNDKSLPRKSDVCKLTNIRSGYKELPLEGLSEDASLELLCKHAFNSNQPKRGYEELSRKVAEYCGGHPLALEVLGSSLYETEAAGWEDTLEKLKREFNLKIEKALKVSFGLLEYSSDEEIIKHIACFFVGEERNYVETILDASSMIPKFIDKCLLTIDPRSNWLNMHKLIQEMGRYLVRQESPQRPYKWSRLWCHDESLDVLRQRKGTKRIKGLILDMNMLDQKNLDYSREAILSADAFKEMKELELLKLNLVRLTGSDKDFPQSLRWLCWHRFPDESMPSYLLMNKLVALDMSHSRLRKLWETTARLDALKILDLSWCCELIATPNFSLLPKLERLTLRGCTSLFEVDESIGDLDRLVFLDMSYCKSLRILPTSFAQLKSLKTLLLNGSPNLHQLVTTEPTSLFNESAPPLEMLDLSSTHIRSLPDWVGKLRGIKTLCLQSCDFLESISLPNNVVVLNVSGCKSLKRVTVVPEPSISPALKLVEKSECHALTEVEGFFKVHPVNEAEENLVNSLGWCGLSFVRHLETRRWDFAYNYPNAASNSRPLFAPVPKNFPAKIVYEFGIFSTWFLGEKVPERLMVHKKDKGASISITVPSCTNIRGLNVCSAHRVPYESLHKSSKQVKINNKTRNLTWIYELQGYDANGTTALVNKYEDVVLLSHWRFGNELIKENDEVSVSIFEDYCETIKEVGISLVYDEIGDRRNGDPLEYYNSRCWKHNVGGDLSPFRLQNGDYYLKSQRLLDVLYR